MFEERITGTVAITGFNYRNEFKVKYALISHKMDGIDSVLGSAVSHVAKVLEQSDTIYNHMSLKELLGRKGLNHRFMWTILVKLRVNFYREMAMIDILLRVMRRIVNEEVKLKSRV